MLNNWMEILRAEVAKSSQSKVAKKLGYSITTVSHILNDKYAGKTDKFAQKVIEVFAVVECPYLNKEIAKPECVEFSSCKAPTHNPIKMQHWRACQQCKERTAQGGHDD